MTVISIIAAVADNGVIGYRGSMPWHLPEDLKRFKALTMGKPIIMGRKTWESLPGRLQGRSNIVVSSRPGVMLRSGGSTPDAVCDSFGRALGLAMSMQEDDPAPEVFVIGGAQLYAMALPLASRLYLTRVHAEPKGDTFFPPWEAGRRWMRVVADPGDGVTFEQWE